MHEKRTNGIESLAGHGTGSEHVDGHQPRDELVDCSRRRNIELGHDDDGARTAVPRDDELTLDARRRQAIAGCCDQHEVDVRREHLTPAAGVETLE